MPEARDRVSRTGDIAEVYARKQRSIKSGGSGPRETLNVFVDDLEDVGSITPFRWGSTPLTGHGVSEVGSPGMIGSGQRDGRVQNGTPATRSSRGRETGQGSGRPSGSILPDWYPRVPLQDITEIVRAIERRRARMREGQSPRIETPVHQQHTIHDVAVSTSGAQFEHNTATFTPYQKGSRRSLSASVPKIMLDITNQNNGDLPGLTPQKKLLNSIDTVEKVVSEELQKMKRTPAAKKVEREKKVKTLMSMR